MFLLLNCKQGSALNKFDLVVVLTGLIQTCHPSLEEEQDPRRKRKLTFEMKHRENSVRKTILHVHQLQMASADPVSSTYLLSWSNHYSAHPFSSNHM